MKNKKLILICVAVVALVLVIAGLNSSPQDPGSPSASPSSSASSQPTFGRWQKAFYVDEFNNPTNKAYIYNKNSFNGTFSNSATNNSSLSAQILIDSDYVSIVLYEYSNMRVKGITTTNYDITILDDNGVKHYTTGTMYENDDRIRLLDTNLINLIKSNERIQIHLVENAKYGYPSSYLFSVTRENFTSVYDDFANTTIQ